MLEFQYPFVFVHTCRVGRIIEWEPISCNAACSQEILTENEI